MRVANVEKMPAAATQIAVEAAAHSHARQCSSCAGDSENAASASARAGASKAAATIGTRKKSCECGPAVEIDSQSIGSKRKCCQPKHRKRVKFIREYGRISGWSGFCCSWESKIFRPKLLSRINVPAFFCFVQALFRSAARRSFVSATLRRCGAKHRKCARCHAAKCARRARARFRLYAVRCRLCCPALRRTSANIDDKSNADCGFR